MSYESTEQNLTSSLQTANPTVFSESTIDDILRLSTAGSSSPRLETIVPDSNGNATVSGGVGVLFIDSSELFPTVIRAPAEVPVLIFQGRGGVIATINDGSTIPSGAQDYVDRVVVGSAGNDNIVVADAKNTKIILGTGDSTVTAGYGVDTVEAGLGNSTIIGGSGDYSVVKLAGNAQNYEVTQQNGRSIVTDIRTDITTVISKIQYVQLDYGNALVFANDSVEAQVGELYHVAMGREADAGGLDFWFDAVRAGASLSQIANGFANSNEFNELHGAQNDADFIQSMYQNTFGRAGEAAGVAFWENALATGATRASLINSFAQIASLNIEGTLHTEVEIVGNVHIVQGII
jgi:hypothetical protein